MAFSSGTFSLIAGNPVATGTTISSTWANDTLSDIATNGLTLCVLKDGTQTITGNIPFAGFRATNVGITGIAGSVGTPSVNFSDTGTGLYRAAANQIGVAIGGSAAGTLSSASFSWLSAFDIAATCSATGYLGTRIDLGGTCSASRYMGGFLSGTFSGTPTFSGAVTMSSTLAAGNTTITGTLLSTGNLTGRAQIISGTTGTSGTFIAVRASDGASASVLKFDGTNTVIDDIPGSGLLLQVGSSTKGTWSSTGLAITGTLNTTASLQVGGTAARATTAGTNRVDIFDGTAPVGTLANGCSFYSTAGEMRVMDSAGNATLLSPHDGDRNWIHHCVKGDGKEILIRMEQMAKFLNDKYGSDFEKEFGVPFLEEKQLSLKEKEVEETHVEEVDGEKQEVKTKRKVKVWA